MTIKFGMDVVDRQTGIVYRFAEGTKVKSPKAFAGDKGAKPLAPEVIEGFAAEFGGSADKWQHAKGIGILLVF